jgi:hypothetical protein
MPPHRPPLPPPPAPASHPISARTAAPSHIMNKARPSTDNQAVQSTTKKRCNHPLLQFTDLSRLAKEARDIAADPPTGIRYHSYIDVDLPTSL